ncbi:MAG: M14 family zinc carboxypeptidase [Bacteroidales bacterium]
MFKRFFILIFLSVLSALSSFSQILTPDDRLRQILSQYGQVDVTLPYTNKLSLELLSANVSILSVKDRVVHVSLSPLTVEWFILQKYDYQIVERAATRRVFSALSLSQAMEWDNYPTYTQYDSIMQSFRTLYPSICRLDTIGTSVNGKLVLALKISDNPGIDGAKPAVFYSSTIHGDEPAGYVVMIHFADYLLKNYSLSNRVKNLVDSLEIWINPLANPDGTYNNGNIIDSPTRYNANGYDLNRNFPDPITPNTIKQKETLDMIRFMRKHKFVISANFHTGEEVVNYPWDRWVRLHADNDWFKSISRKYADTVHLNSVSGYMTFLDDGITNGYQWYPVYGGRQDFMTWELHGREVTIELDNESVTPAVQLPVLWQYNWHSLLGYLENALYGIHGFVRNVKSQAPVPAKVFIKGYDKDSSQVYSDTITGSFERYLTPGSWNLTFSSSGYSDTTINAIVVSGQKTDLTVDMSLLPSVIEPINSTTHLLIYPDPATDVINIIFPDKNEGRMNFRIIDQAGILVSDYSAEVVQGIPVLINVNTLKSGIYIITFTNPITGTSFYGRFVIIK